MCRLPLATVALVGLVLAAHGLELAGGGLPVCWALGFTPADPSLATMLTAMLLHDPDHITHVAGNVLALAILGAVVEAELGPALVAVFGAAGVGGAVVHWLVDPTSTTRLIGCSGAVCGVLAVAAVARPRLVLGFAVSFMLINLVGLYVTTPLISSGTSVGAHIGGFAVGALFAIVGRVRGVPWATESAPGG